MTNSIFTKECTLCGKVKDIIDFPRDNNKKCGRGTRCKKCVSEMVKARNEEIKARKEFEII